MRYPRLENERGGERIMIDPVSAALIAAVIAGVTGGVTDAGC